MGQFELLMPKLGESVEEATITQWFVKVGDRVDDDDVLLEIATDKVDSEIPSPVSGTVAEIRADKDQTVSVGTVIALIDTGADDDKKTGQVESGAEITENASERKGEPVESVKEKKAGKSTDEESEQEVPAAVMNKREEAGRFYSPLVLTIARQEGISQEVLDNIPGSGRHGRVQKKDILSYLSSRISSESVQELQAPATRGREKTEAAVSPGAGDEIIEMDRMRKLIAEHMIMSKRTSAHVTNMLEADVTDIVLWRNKVKDVFLKREGEKITYLPIFLEATIQALKDFPMINASVDGERIIVRKKLNLGIAVALPSGNLIVPVIKNADALNLLGLTKALNKMAENARNNKLSPDDITGGTFTVSNFGTFRNAMGTPIINQPQVAILAIGTVEKKPAVIETPTGDVIGIRHKMFLSLTYDHRIIDGAYGGAFLRKLGDYLESFDSNRTI